MLLTTSAETMGKKKDLKHTLPQVAKPQSPKTDDDRTLSRAVPSRLFQKDLDALLVYEKNGLNMSDLIRRCVRKSLPDVVAEIRDELQPPSKPS